MSSPGQASAGMPIQGASITAPRSYSPKNPAAIPPTPIPMSGAQRRTSPVPTAPTMRIATKVTPALTGAAATGAPSGMSSSMSKAMGVTVTEISMMTMPATIGVTMRRTNDSWAANRNWNSEEAMTSVASSPGPPSASAVMLTAMNAPEVPMKRM